MLEFPAQMALSPLPACATPSSDPPLQEWILLSMCLSLPLDAFFALSSETALYKIATAPPPPSPAFLIFLVCLSFPKLFLPSNLPYNVPVLLYYSYYLLEDR